MLSYIAPNLSPAVEVQQSHWGERLSSKEYGDSPALPYPWLRAQRFTFILFQPVFAKQRLRAM